MWDCGWMNYISLNKTSNVFDAFFVPFCFWNPVGKGYESLDRLVPKRRTK